MEKMNQWSLKGYVVVNNTPPEQLERVKINQCISENQEWKGRWKKEGDSFYSSQRWGYTDKNKTQIETLSDKYTNLKVVSVWISVYLYIFFYRIAGHRLNE